jgi:hypothetical protein
VTSESDGLGTIHYLTGEDVAGIVTEHLAHVKNLTMVLGEYSHIDVPSSLDGTTKIRVHFNVKLGQELVKLALNKEKGNPAIKFNILRS